MTDAYPQTQPTPPEFDSYEICLTEMALLGWDKATTNEMYQQFQQKTKQKIIDGSSADMALIQTHKDFSDQYNETIALCLTMWMACKQHTHQLVAAAQNRLGKQNKR